MLVRLPDSTRIGLERRGFDPADVRALELAFHTLLRSHLNTSQALAKLEREGVEVELVQRVIEFIRSSPRGIIKSERGGRRGS